MRDIVITPHLADWPQIFQPQVQLLCWQRPMPAGVAGYLDSLAASGSLRLGYRGMLSAGEAPVLAAWPADAGRQALQDDITLLADMYATLLGCAQVGWRVEVLDGSMCPRFHVDRTGIRLVCTWRGPGTEWLSGADRRFLGRGSGGLPDETSGLMRTGEVGRSVAGEVVLLKGSQWQGNGDAGAIHRSPAAGSQLPRVLLVLDAMY